MNTRHGPRRAAPIAMTIALLSLAGCGENKQAATIAPQSVTVASVHRATITLSVDYPARIRSTQEIVVSPKIAGRVASVRADVSQRVRSGEVLFTLESSDNETELRQAQAAVESAKANLTRTSDSSLSSQVIQAQAAVKQAQVQCADARDIYERTQKLFTDGAVSRQQLDSTKAKLDSAEIALDTAAKIANLSPQCTAILR